ncbi:MAG: universal stress protein [Blastocatellia bacterium]|nr:universal stress protein [Blastocatellia bacterium]
MRFDDILVPTDFSESSSRALDYALSMASPEGEIYLLHVIDSDFLEEVSRNEIASVESVQEKLRQRAEETLDQIISKSSCNEPNTAKLNKMVVVGLPFVEILRIAKDLDFSLIVMGIRGKKGSIEKLFFGSTADKVLRATHIPVVCVPL